MDFVVLADQSKDQRKRKERQILRPSERTEKAMEHQNDGDTNCNRCTWKDPKKLGKVEKQRTKRDYPNYSIVKISQNTEKSPGDLRRAAASRTPDEDH